MLNTRHGLSLEPLWAHAETAEPRLRRSSIQTTNTRFQKKYVSPRNIVEGKTGEVTICHSVWGRGQVDSTVLSQPQYYTQEELHL